MAADGSIVFRVDADDKEAQKKLDKLRRDIEKTAAAIEASEAKKNGISEQLQSAREEAEKTAQAISELQDMMAANQRYMSGKNGDIDIFELKKRRIIQEQLQQELEEQQKIYNEQAKKVEKLEEQEANVLTTLEQQTQQLEQQQAQAGDIEKAIAEQQSANEGLEEATDKVSDSVKKGFSSLIKWSVVIKAIEKVAKAMFEGIKEGFLEFAKYDKETRDNMSRLRSSLATLKASWGAAFAPIFNAVAPLLQKLIAWLTDAGNAVARFMAIVTGKPSYKKAVANNDALAGSLGDVGSAAKEAKRQLMGFDELNVLNGSTGGVGGLSGADFELIEETIDMLDGGTFLDRLALSIKDVFFDWSDLNPEQIAKKCITGLCALLGGVTGFVFGGVPGAIIGTIAGIVISLLIESAIFNNDGQLSKDEVAHMLKYALGLVLGGAIGLAVGGPGGALLGAVIGLGVTLGIDAIHFEIAKQPSRAKYADDVSWFVCEILGMPTDQEIIAWFKGVGDWIAEGLLDFGHELDLLFVQPVRDIWADLQLLWEDITKWWNGLHLDEFHIPKPVFEWTYTEATGALASVLNFFGLSPTIPHLNITWAAKGGIIDGATLIGAGEAGKEAILPLERNTGWIKTLAEELLSAMESKSYINDMPQVASGQLVPPGAAYGSYGDFGIDILQELKSLRNEIVALAQQPIEVTTGVNLDRREIGRAVTLFQRQEGRMIG